MKHAGKAVYSHSLDPNMILHHLLRAIWAVWS